MNEKNVRIILKARDDAVRMTRQEATAMRTTWTGRRGIGDLAGRPDRRGIGGQRV